MIMKTNIVLSLAMAIALPAAAQAQVVVNEFCASNDTLEVMGQTCDWVELYNTGTDEVNLKGYALSDNPKKPQKYVIDKDVTIYPGCFKLVLCNGLGTDLNTSFRLSADGSEYVVFSDPKGNTIDEISIPKLGRDYSYARLNDGGSQWGIFDISTPGNTNAAQQALTAMPEFSVKAGFYTKTVTLSMSCADPDAEIYFTVDGSQPTTSSSKYTQAFSVASTRPVRAIAVSPGKKESRTATATYFINLRKVDLPVVCITTDRKNFYDNRIGIYVAGTNGVAGPCTDGQRRNWHQDWERPIHIEYFDKNKVLQLSQDAGVKITGSCSRNNDMKSLRIIARKEYGDNRLRYKFFDKKDISEFKSIVLRNGGNDFGGTMIRDGLVTGLAGESLNVDVQGFQPCAVFLNGEYLGLHNIREKVSTHFAEENYGAEAENVDLLENKWTVIDGSNKEFNTLMDFVRNSNLSNPTNYMKVADQIDIDNFIDYWCAQIYIDNEDWPNNNIKFFKPRGQNSKWRWIMFGAEYSCGVYNGGPEVNSIHHDIDPNTGRLGSSEWGGLLMRALLKNDDFKNRFIQRMSYVIDHTYNPSRVEDFADSLRSIMYNEWGYHYSKYYGWINQREWSNRIDNLVNWFGRRPDYVREHVRQYFGLRGSYNVNVTSDNADAKFSVNGSMATANISGKYFGGAAFELSAKLPAGVAVDHWEVGGDNTVSKAVFGYGDRWSYSDAGTAPASNWKTSASDPSGWKSGNASLGFSDVWTPITPINGGPSNNRYPAFYFRKVVNISDISNIQGAVLTIKVDDGAVVYLNGKEQGRYNMSEGNVTHDTWASSYVQYLDEKPIRLNVGDFVQGNNIIAVEVHQTSNTSSDAWMDAKLDLQMLDGNGSQKYTGNSVSLNLASDTKIRLVTKAAPNLTCENRSQSVKGAIYINEVMTRNNGVLADETNHYPAWVEFYNASDKAIDMAGLYVMDAKNEVKIPCGDFSNTMIPSHGYLVYFLDGRTDLGASHLGINLATDGETALYLGERVDGQSNYVDWIEIPSIKKGFSYGRKADGDNQWVAFDKSSAYVSNAKGEVSPLSPVYTAVDDISHENLPVIEAYPNPTSGLVYLRADNIDSEIRYEVLSLQGQLLMKGVGDTVDMQALPSAMYLIRVSANGYKTSIKVIRK